MHAAKPASLNHPACLPRLALDVAVVLGLGLNLPGADATAQTRATLGPGARKATTPSSWILSVHVGSDRR